MQKRPFACRFYSVAEKIFIIEDIPEMADLISMYMKRAGFATEAFEKAETALSALRAGDLPALVILDLNLPGMSGFDFLRIFRDEFKSSIPIIVASARSSDEDIIRTLGLGADEFIEKPFSPRVLMARARSILARFSAVQAAAEETVVFGPYTLSLGSCILRRGDQRIPLSSKEYDILEYLVKNSGRYLRPREIFNAVWHVDYGDVGTVRVFIQRLRQKIEDDPAHPVYITTEFGKGYRFNAEPPAAPVT